MNALFHADLRELHEACFELVTARLGGGKTLECRHTAQFGKVCSSQFALNSDVKTVISNSRASINCESFHLAFSRTFYVFYMDSEDLTNLQPPASTFDPTTSRKPSTSRDSRDLNAALPSLSPWFDCTNACLRRGAKGASLNRGYLQSSTSA